MANKCLNIEVHIFSHLSQRYFQVHKIELVLLNNWREQNTALVKVAARAIHSRVFKCVTSRRCQARNTERKFQYHVCGVLIQLLLDDLFYLNVFIVNNIVSCIQTLSSFTGTHVLCFLCDNQPMVNDFPHNAVRVSFPKSLRCTGVCHQITVFLARAVNRSG